MVDIVKKPAFWLFVLLIAGAAAILFYKPANAEAAAKK